MRRLAILCTIVSAALLAAGCPGTLEIWGVNVPIPDGTGDDDDTASIVWDNYDGTEILNIDWSPEEEADGHFDCLAEWRAQGAETTLDDDNLCTACDHIWEINMVAQPGADECLQQGTGIDVPGSYVRKVGFELSESIDFLVWRTAFSVQAPLGSSQNEPLAEAGIGAFQGTEYTWSGLDTPMDNDQLGYEFFFSGEGQF
jgi:hypothetical protein